MAAVFLVKGMSCQHCVGAITAAVRRVPGVTDVGVDSKNGLVTVGGKPDQCSVAAAIEDSGYDVDLSDAAGVS